MKQHLATAADYAARVTGEIEATAASGELGASAARGSRFGQRESSETGISPYGSSSPGFSIVADFSAVESREVCPERCGLRMGVQSAGFEQPQGALVVPS